MYKSWIIVCMTAVLLFVSGCGGGPPQQQDPGLPTATTKFKGTLTCGGGINQYNEIYYSKNKDGGPAFKVEFFEFVEVDDFGTDGCQSHWDQKTYVWKSGGPNSSDVMFAQQTEIDKFLAASK